MTFPEVELSDVYRRQQAERARTLDVENAALREELLRMMTEKTKFAVEPRKNATLVQVTIAAGDALSGAADLTGGAVYYVIGPSDWTADPNNPLNVGQQVFVSFQVSYDNISYFDLFDSNGYEVTRIIAPGAAVAIDAALTAAAMYLKIRAGSRTNLVTQEADRTFTLMML